MQEANCYLCGSAEAIRLFVQEGQDPYADIISPQLREIERYWCVCESCGFIYRSPTLEHNELRRLYEHYEKDVFHNISPDAYFEKIIALPRQESENVQKTLWLRDQFAKIRHYSSRFSVLDVGCGGGTLLYAFAREFPSTSLYGVELNGAYAGLARRKLHAEIKNTWYRDGLFEQKFDVILCTKVLEHIADPRQFLGQLAADLDEEGLLFLEVPDSSDVVTLPPDNERFFIPHLFFFSASTLAVLLEEAGLMVMEKRTIFTPRGRSYLQLLASHGRTAEDEKRRKPYDDPWEIIRQRQQAAAGGFSGTKK